MEVVRITPRGYCHGVVEAIRIAKRVGSERAEGEQVTMLGYLVHNEHVTRELEEHGVLLVDAPDRMKGLDQIESGTVVFTAHGISPVVVAEAKRRGLNVVDATCSDVTRYGATGFDSGALRTGSSSTVVRGPLKVCRALTSHQMPTAMNTPPVTTGV